MASTDKELEEELLQAGEKLVDPPSSVDDLLSLLCQVESCLSRVEQSPTESMQNALSPSLKVLIANKLLRHSDVDVKVAVASCFSEITRITAPDAPYDDDQMKEVFRLIVSSFENLHDSSNRWYQKRILILETVAKVRSCVVMLDLECDDLILEMFQHFLKTIREHHPGNVFLSMETIMVLVLEESEDISLDLLSPILDSVKKDNEEVMPIARKLGERVLQSCAARLKPYLVQAVNTLGISLDDYSDVLASVCKDTSDNLALNDVHDCKSAEEPVEESAQMSIFLHQVDSEITKEATPPQQDNAAEDRSPKSVMSNGIAQAGEDDALIDSKSLKNQDDTDSSVLSKGNNLSGNDLDIVKVDNKEQKPEQSTKKEQSTKRGVRKSSSSKSSKLSKNSSAVSEKEAEKTNDSKSHIKEVPSSLNEDGVVEATGTSENDKEIKVKISSTKEGDVESDAVVSPSPSESNHDENRSRKRARTKKKDISVKQVAAEDNSKRVSEGTCDSEVKSTKPSAKKGLGRSADMKITTFVDAVKKGSGKAEERTKGDGGSSSRKSEEKKRKGQEKGNLEKGLARSSSKDEDKAVASSLKSARKTTKDEHPEETPKTNLKRKRTSGKEKESDIKKNDESLVGTRVKVWWPDDEMFYEGVVDSFDSSIKKHKVLYDDGDEEILNFEEEKWEIIEAADPDGEDGSHRASPDPSDDMPLKKKGKTNAGESKKEGKRDSSSKSGGVTSSKSKGPSVKSNQKSKTVGKSEGEVSRKSKDAAQKTGGKSEDRSLKSSGKSEDRLLKSGGKSEDRPLKSGSKSEDRLLKTGGKSEDRLLKTGSKSEDRLLKTGGKSEDRPLKSGGKSIDSAHKNNSKKTDASKIRKSKDDDVDTPKQKPKQETPKTGKPKQGTSKIALSSKTKSTKSGKSNTNGTGKVKFILPKTEDSENSENENSDDSTNEVEDRKVKTPSSSKAGSEVKSGKKRGRN